MFPMRGEDGGVPYYHKKMSKSHTWGGGRTDLIKFCTYTVPDEGEMQCKRKQLGWGSALQYIWKIFYFAHFVCVCQGWNVWWSCFVQVPFNAYKNSILSILNVFAKGEMFDKTACDKHISKYFILKKMKCQKNISNI